MFYIDIMGNLLSNMRLAFYENIEEAGFFTKMFSGSEEKAYKDNLAKSYAIIQEVYNDLLAPVMFKQLQVDQEMMDEVSKMVKLINYNISRDKSIDDFKFKLVHLQNYQNNSSIYDHYATHVLGIECYKMTENEYRDALVGMPLSEGGHHHNTQILLAPKINLLNQ